MPQKQSRFLTFKKKLDYINKQKRQFAPSVYFDKSTCLPRTVFTVEVRERPILERKTYSSNCQICLSRLKCRQTPTPTKAMTASIPASPKTAVAITRVIAVMLKSQSECPRRSTPKLILQKKFISSKLFTTC